MQHGILAFFDKAPTGFVFLVLPVSKLLSNLIELVVVKCVAKVKRNQHCNESRNIYELNE